MKISIFTTYTNPEKRMDPWKEATQCYGEFADEVIVTGQNWPEEFKFSYIGEQFQQGFENATGDWVIKMDIDTMFHEKTFKKLKKFLENNSDKPAVILPKYQFFSFKKFHVKSTMCTIVNKKKFPQIKFNGGGDLCDPTLNGKLLNELNLPKLNIPIWNYDSTFKTKEVISIDRARFARAWNKEFGNWGDRGDGTPENAFNAWFNMVKNRYQFHIGSVDISQHPKFIQEKLLNIDELQFGYSLFGLANNQNKITMDKIRSYKAYLNNYYKF